MVARRRSAGIVLVRAVGKAAELLLVHPGGPFWAKRDAGAWSIPKGEYGEDEDPFAAAVREFREELGIDCPATDLIELGEITQAGGKVVTAWCGLGTIDTAVIESNTFEMEWPPKSGRLQRFPEVDRAGFFNLTEANERIIAAQQPLLDQAIRALGLSA